MEEHHRAVEVAPGVDRVVVAAGLLGRHVGGRADERAHARRVHAGALAVAAAVGERALGDGGGVALRGERAWRCPSPSARPRRSGRPSRWRA